MSTHIPKSDAVNFHTLQFFSYRHSSRLFTSHFKHRRLRLHFVSGGLAAAVVFHGCWKWYCLCRCWAPQLAGCLLLAAVVRRWLAVDASPVPATFSTAAAAYDTSPYTLAMHAIVKVWSCRPHMVQVEVGDSNFSVSELESFFTHNTNGKNKQANNKK